MQKHDILKLPNTIKIDQCKHCNALFLAGKWILFNLSELKKYIIKQIKTSMENPNFEMNILEGKVIGVVDGKIGNNKVTQEFDLPYKVHMITCDTCMKRSSKFWQLKIQLRKDRSCDIKKYENMKKLLERKKDFKKDTKQGPDFYFISISDNRDFIKHLSHKFYVKPIMSKRFAGFTKSRGKKIKYTYCFRA